MSGQKYTEYSASSTGRSNQFAANPGGPGRKLVEPESPASLNFPNQGKKLARGFLEYSDCHPWEVETHKNQFILDSLETLAVATWLSFHNCAAALKYEVTELG